jgi:hypothetical protein
MANVVSGVAGSIRLKQLKANDLTVAEKHGKRLDESSKRRSVIDAPPITSSGLELRDLYRGHVEGAFIPEGTKFCAHHLLIQFPKDLVDGNQGDWMLERARGFAERVFGDQAVFADRLDRDERSRHVVDLFVAPKYVKKTKRTEKVAVSMTRHLKLLAKKHGRPPTPPGIGSALQDELFEYFKEIGLERVQRGGEKELPGKDWRSSEMLRSEQLNRLESTLKLKQSDLDRRQGGLELKQVEVNNQQTKLLKDQADFGRERMRWSEEVEQDHVTLGCRKEQLDRNENGFNLQMARERAQMAKERQEAIQKREEAEEALEARSRALDARSKALEASEVVMAAKERGLTAMVGGEIVRVGLTPNGTKGLLFSAEVRADPNRLEELKRAIMPAWDWIIERLEKLGNLRQAYLNHMEDLKAKAAELGNLHKAMTPYAKMSIEQQLPEAAKLLPVARNIAQQPAREANADLDLEVLKAFRERGMGR